MTGNSAITNEADKLTTDTEINGQQVRIRPINDQDLLREKNFVEHLSPLSQHFRFLGGVGHLSEAALKSFCEIDYDSKMGFIATIDINGEEQEIGVSRYAVDNDGDCECAVTVADEWQHHGLGRLLMNRLIEFARNQGKEGIYSLDSANNSHMRKLAKDLGMSAKRDAGDATLVKYELQL